MLWQSVRKMRSYFATGLYPSLSQEWHPIISIDTRSFWVTNRQRQLEEKEGIIFHMFAGEPMRSQSVGVKASLPFGRLELVLRCLASYKYRAIKLVWFPSTVKKLPSINLASPKTIGGDNLCSCWGKVAGVCRRHRLISPIYFYILWPKNKIAPSRGISTLEK